MDQDCFTEMLDYTIELFESKGLGRDYYGYHNINHELEVTYVTLLSVDWDHPSNEIAKEDFKYLYVAALFHDYDPEKSVDKPHEDSVINFLSSDQKLKDLLDSADIDIEIIKALILRTTYPWTGKLKEDAENKIIQCYKTSSLTKDDELKRDHYSKLGWFLSVVDRISGYALGDFASSMELAKMNAHALAWHPSVLVQRSVNYFEQILNEETVMLERILESLPKQIRKNFMDNVLAFFALREQEIQIHAKYVYENLKLVPLIEKMAKRKDSEFIYTLAKIYEEMPVPLQFSKGWFDVSIKNPDTILNTLRISDCKGEIIGFAKGGPLETYKLRPEIKDENFNRNNTVFLEPISLKSGYWGMHGGSEMRHLFSMQAHSKGYKYLTGFALRDVIDKRAETYENAEFVNKFDPERWDYYRIKL